MRVEFYGVPRIRARRPELELPAMATLGEALDAIAEQLPDVAQECLEHDANQLLQLRAAYVVSVDGERFVRSRDEPLDLIGEQGALLLLAADAGG